MSSRITFKSVLTDLKQTATPFVIAGGGDGKVGFTLYGSDGTPVEGASFMTKNIGSIPNKIVSTMAEVAPQSEFSKRYVEAPAASPTPQPEQAVA